MSCRDYIIAVFGCAPNGPPARTRLLLPGVTSAPALRLTPLHQNSPSRSQMMKREKTVRRSMTQAAQALVISQVRADVERKPRQYPIRGLTFAALAHRVCHLDQCHGRIEI